MGMTQLGKILSQAGFEPWIFRSRGRRLNHKANKVVDDDENDDDDDGYDDDDDVVC